MWETSFTLAGVWEKLTHSNKYAYLQIMIFAVICIHMYLSTMQNDKNPCSLNGRITKLFITLLKLDGSVHKTFLAHVFVSCVLTVFPWSAVPESHTTHGLMYDYMLILTDFRNIKTGNTFNQASQSQRSSGAPPLLKKCVCKVNGPSRTTRWNLTSPIAQMR